MQKKWNHDKLKNKIIQESFEAEVTSKLDKECKHQTIRDRWEALRENILDSAKKNIGIIKQERAKKSWITGEMIDKMEERRKWKSVNTEARRQKYKQLNNELRRITDEAKEIRWANQCSELESLDRQGRSDLMYAKVNELTKTKILTSKSSSLKDKNGNLLTKPKEIKLRWKEHIEELYAKQDKPTQIIIENKVDV